MNVRLIDRDKQETPIQEVLNEDALWEKLIAVENRRYVRVEFDSGEYEVKVMFINSNGSTIFAKGKDTDRLHAIIRCLQEVERLW